VARLLAELAALPPDQRAALAALLTALLAAPFPTTPAPLDDRVPWGRDKEEDGT
jgi:hypothetical protein